MKMLDHSRSSNSSLLKVTPNKKILEGLSTIQSRELMARLDHTSGGSIPKKVTLTCLATSYSLVCTSSTQCFPLNAGFVLYSTLLIIFFSDKEKISLNDQIYFTTLGWGQCHNLNKLKFTLLF